MNVRPNSPAARDIAHHLHPYTNWRRHEADGPLIINSGKGIYVQDDQGKEYIEGMAGLWCTSLGFGEERLVQAAAEQMRKLPYYHAFAHKSHNPGIDLAERLADMTPGDLNHVFFANSGSEANDTVVKFVWYFNNALGRPEKKKIISRIKGYHGVTVASASMTGLPNNHRDFDLPIANILHTECPHYYRFGQEGETEDAFATRMADALEAKILEEGPETVAAFIGEPVMGAGGVIVPPRTYWKKIQAVCRKYDILVIADEVICGFGRTGEMFGSQTFEIQPDIMVVAKQLSSAYLPISAVIISDKVYDALADNSAKIGTFGHGYTYSGHPVAAAVAVETLKIYEERDILSHVKAVAPLFQEGLRKFADHPHVGEVRGVGLVGAVELVADKTTKASFDPAGPVGVQLDKRAIANGVILRNIVDSLAFCPPLIITDKQIKELFDRFGKALDETEAWIKAEGLAV
ncbi:aspartate aminotransferase family protein [Limibacillus halophilus]|uniref:4-aminobutyrate--pyruvate transaminase n=1 Tax=Limibacillus halophilus TaxID=1579333 RepID=A0A839SUJ7_9PROT|nr:aspartate aminotransferase family protein [Limibacillus halophilus]MBB3064613.1 4-aminobutyrate--pyruvate transaminase [Limibacillus halophilus]